MPGAAAPGRPALRCWRPGVGAEGRRGTARAERERRRRHAWFGRRLCAAKSTRAGVRGPRGAVLQAPRAGSDRPRHTTTARAPPVRTRWPRTSSSATSTARCGPSSPSRGSPGSGRSGGARTASGPRSAASTSAALRYGAITAIGFEFPEAARFLRLDPPAGSHLAYGLPRLAVLEGERPDRDPHPGRWPPDERPPPRRGLPVRPGRPRSLGDRSPARSAPRPSPSAGASSSGRPASSLDRRGGREPRRARRDLRPPRGLPRARPR